MLNDDMTKVSASPNASTDPLGCRLKSCLNVSLLGLKNEELQIYTRQNEDKVLILIEYDNISDVQKSSRKVIVETVEDCYKLGNLQYPKKLFIGVRGSLALRMVRTPYINNVTGDFASESDLYPFYDKTPIDTLGVQEDSIAADSMRHKH